MAGLYWHGYGVKRDYEKGLDLYNEAAKHGDPVANYSLGLIDFRRSSNMYAEGLRHMKNAAKKNYGPALTAVGVLALSQDRNNQKLFMRQLISLNRPMTVVTLQELFFIL